MKWIKYDGTNEPPLHRHFIPMLEIVREWYGGYVTSFELDEQIYYRDDDGYLMCAHRDAMGVHPIDESMPWGWGLYEREKGIVGWWYLVLEGPNGETEI